VNEFAHKPLILSSQASFERDLLSHGFLSSDIPGISIGAERLARGIITDFFNEEREMYYKKLKKF